MLVIRRIAHVNRTWVLPSRFERHDLGFGCFWLDCCPSALVRYQPTP